jgi:hypothetical protein
MNQQNTQLGSDNVSNLDSFNALDNLGSVGDLDSDYTDDQHAQANADLDALGGDATVDLTL